eukprot:evm.model.scf_58.8 EVM.evm.TU.scf_58.8   scf_58:69130-77261(+)
MPIFPARLLAAALLCALTGADIPLRAAATDEAVFQAALLAKERATSRRALLYIFEALSGNGWTQSGVPALNVSALEPGRLADLRIYLGLNATPDATSSATLLPTVPFGTAGVGYCLWLGVKCCLGLWAEMEAPYRCGDVESALEVAELHMAGWNLSGAVPVNMGRLNGLQKVVVADNPGLRGELHCSLGTLHNLYYFDIRNTSLAPVSIPLRQPQEAINCNGQFQDDECHAPWLTGFNPNRTAIVARYPNGQSLLCCNAQYRHNIRQYNTFVKITYFQDAGFFNFTNCYCWHNDPQLAHRWDEGSELSGDAPTCEEAAEAVKTLLVSNATAMVTVRRSTSWVAIVVPVVASIAIAALAAVVLARKPLSGKGDLVKAKRKVAPGLMEGGTLQDPQSVTLVMTDVQGSTELWEWRDDVTAQSVELHDALMRAMMPVFGGHEVTTEGDSFTIAFHCPLDALAYCMCCQMELLLLPWSPELCRQPQAMRVPWSRVAHSGVGAGAVFNGLRIRMAVASGRPDDIRIHHVTKQHEYFGPLVMTADSLSAVASGGMILADTNTFCAVNGRLGELAELIQTNEENIKAIRRKMRLKTALASSSAPGRSSLGNPRMTEMQHHLLAFFTQSFRRPEGTKADMDPHAVASREMSQMLLSATDQEKKMGSAASFSLARGEGTECVPANSTPLRLTFYQRLLDRLRGRGWRRFSHSRSGAHRSLMEKFLVEKAAWDAKPMLVHLGWHAFVNHLGDLDEGLWIEEVVAVLPFSLASRLGLFAPLHTVEQVGPSFYDAPGAVQFLASLKQSIHRQAPAFDSLRSEITMAFCSPAGLKGLLPNPTLGEEALTLFRECVSESIMSCKGYECQEKDGTFMIAFSCPMDALDWSCSLHIALLGLPWPTELRYFDRCQKVLSDDGKVLFRGLSARIGIFRGEARTLPHATTGSD